MGEEWKDIVFNEEERNKVGKISSMINFLVNEIEREKKKLFVYVQELERQKKLLEEEGEKLSKKYSIPESVQWAVTDTGNLFILGEKNNGD